MEDPRIGSTEIKAEDDAGGTLVFISDPEIIHEDFMEKVASKGSKNFNAFIIIASPELSIDVPLGGSPADAGTDSDGEGDQAGHAAMFGRYMGQIRARVERAWSKPRSTVENGRFKCTAQIKQDVRGAVLEVMLSECGIEPDWQVSLVRAIERSSPLPAPPEPSVFTTALRLSFEARGFDPEISTEGFAPVTQSNDRLVAGSSIESADSMDIAFHTLAINDAASLPK